MEIYIAQKADQALEALGSESSLPERLALAKAHFGLVATKRFLASAPPDVRGSITTFMETEIERDPLESSRACRSAILAVLEAFARQDVSSEARAN